MVYAKDTKVDVGKTRDEIERMLTRRGSEAFGSGTASGKIYVVFELNGIKIRFEIPAPAREEFIRTESGRARTDSAIQSDYEQAQKQRWRSLLLSIKAKLISIDEDIETFEQAFLAHIMTNNGTTIGEQIIPRLPAAISSAEIKLLTS